jgi:ParB-like chromosome segregation protein Spo0J
MSDAKKITISEIPLVKLVPRHRRKIDPQLLQRLEASLQLHGLITPLTVIVQEDHYEILDGNSRYEVLLAMGVETVPCITRS